MKFKRISSSLVMGDNEAIMTSIMFECLKSFLNQGYYVHFISKTKVEEIPWAIHGGLKPTVDAFSRLSLKYFENVDQVLEYACGLQCIQSRHGKYPKVVMVQNYEIFLSNEPKGALVTAMILDAINALSRTFNAPTYFLAALKTSEKSSIRILPALIDNYFTSVWKLITGVDESSLVKLPENDFCAKKTEIKFKIGKDNTLFLSNILEYLDIPIELSENDTNSNHETEVVPSQGLNQ